MRSQALNVPSVETHTGFYKVKVVFFEFSPFYRLLFVLALSKLRQLGAEAVVDLSMSIPELPFDLVSCSCFEVEKNVVLAGIPIPRPVSGYCTSEEYVRTAIADVRY